MKTENNSTNLKGLEDIRIAEQRMFDIHAGRTKTLTLEDAASLIPVETPDILDNVYADIGVANPEKMLSKARTVAQISQVISRPTCTVEKAANVIGLSDTQLKNLLRGQFQGYEEKDLLEYLEKLNQSESFAGAKLAE